AQHLANPMATPSPTAGPSPRVAGSPQPCFPFGFCQLFDPLANLLQHLPLQLIPSLCDQARQCYVGLAHEGVSFLLLSTGVWLSGDTLFSFTSEFQHEMLQPRKHVLFWADMQNVLQKHPEIIPQLPPGLIAIPWHDFLEMDYSPWLAPLAAHHIPEFASTYIHNCLSIFPDFNQTFLIIDGILATARKYGASGMLINLWTDSNQDLYRMALAGMAYGAAAPWQSGPMAREQFFSDYARIVYPPALAAEVAPALQEMSDAETLMEKVFGQETMVMMWADPFSPDNLEHYRGHHDDLRQVRL